MGSTSLVCPIPHYDVVNFQNIHNRHPMFTHDGITSVYSGSSKYQLRSVLIIIMLCALLYWTRDHFVYVPSQWEMTLHCNVTWSLFHLVTMRPDRVYCSAGTTWRLRKSPVSSPVFRRQRRDTLSGVGNYQLIADSPGKETRTRHVIVTVTDLTCGIVLPLWNYCNDIELWHFSGSVLIVRW